jgi:hypothetical protein
LFLLTGAFGLKGARQLEMVAGFGFEPAAPVVSAHAFTGGLEIGQTGCGQPINFFVHRHIIYQARFEEMRFLAGRRGGSGWIASGGKII